MQRPQFLAKWPNLGKIWVNFGQKGPFFNFPKKYENIICFRLQRLGLVQQARDAGSLD